MQSHLTRHVFRAILNNEPLCSTRCRHQFLHMASNPRSRRTRLPCSHFTQRRSLFAFGAPQSVEQPTALPSETGLKEMSDLIRAMSKKRRAPPNEVLTKAFQDFFAARLEHAGVITGFQAHLLLSTWKYLKAQQEELESTEWSAVFSTEALESILLVLSEAECLPESAPIVRKLARFAFLEICSHYGFDANPVSRSTLITYINLLSSNGDPDEAAQVFEKFSLQLRDCNQSPWLAVMKGFALKGDWRRIQRITKMLETQGSKFDAVSHEELIKILIGQNLLTAAKAIYDCAISDGQEPSLSTKARVIKFALLNSEVEWAGFIFQTLPQTPTAETLNTMLLWDVAHGKKASDISDSLQELVRQDPEVRSFLNISTVNDLVEYANSSGNPQLAAEFAALAHQWGLEFDTTTRLLQLESRIQARDISGTFQSLQALDHTSTMATENLPLMNKLITMLCLSGSKDALFDQISLLLDPLFESDIRLEARTVAALTHMLLYRHDWDAVSELLRPRLGLYESEERNEIRDAVLKFVLDLDQASEDAWEAYGLLQIAFPEMSVGIRTDIMSCFFKREKSDLACMVFGHMRQADTLSQRPKPDTYARCFQGIAGTADPTNLELVHNMLKLDLEVDLDTRILNALMLAYTACEMPEKSMEIFRDILQTDEGPNATTIAIFFKVCEKHHNGTQEAMKMMSKIKLLEIPVDRKLYSAYIEALAAQCEFDQATDAINKMQDEISFSPTRTTIGLFYNAIPYPYWKDQVEAWAKTNYPEQWAQLEPLNRTEHEEGLQFDSISSPVYI
ncbi:hypothetical protein ASPZODRAFT_154752 [Penicilliopsis zonata CBS 506.65]|uniref:Importin N-terminal domain-containing protein n=1 Tax=Penicilliopsis zonata CBS 506.65 TaxID=1073090 RepID=A0A1L9S812_9EURO|nr:hypothetical protein ASPZODRAFT_154752 [Penicilliopsis zonata CBS 506.65]OJJ43303.1 hypothetical protein ASPZODRAFT_154752 [Penicilliopsis zonata CBS 506.65]